MKQDWQITLEKGHKRDSTRIATQIANKVSWLKLWDAMLDEGVHGTVRLQSLYKAITWPKVGNISVCPSCEWESNTHLLPHLLEIHLQLREEDIITLLTSASTRDILLVANQVHQLLQSQNSRGS